MSGVSPQALAELRAVNDMLSRRSLAAFIRTVWPYLEGEDAPLVWNWHIDALADALQAISRGEITRLLINIPPGHFKSSSVNVAWPCWEWGSVEMDLAYIFVMYGDRPAIKEHRRRRRILDTDWYRDWSGIANAATERGCDPYTKLDEHVCENAAGGVMYASSMHAAGTGYHASRLVLDDPLNADDARTVELVHHVTTYKEKWANRLKDVRKSAQVVVMQRLHTDDLAGVLDRDPSWHVLRLPAEHDPSRSKITVPGIVDPRSPGEPLFPQRFPLSYLQHQKSAHGMGPVRYAAQYQQSPVAEGGNIVNPDWFRHWRDDVPESHPNALPESMDQLVASWDLTFKGGPGTDFVVGQVWGKKDNRFYLLDQCRARLSFTETKARFRDWATTRWPDVLRWLVEEKANGAAILDELRNEVAGLIPIRPRESKEERLHSVAGLIQSGCVWLPDPELYPWTSGLMAEVAAFPLGSHDDRVDAMTQALRDMATRARTFTLPDAVAHPRPIEAPDPRREHERAWADTEAAEERRAREWRPEPGPGMRTVRRPPWDRGPSY